MEPILAIFYSYSGTSRRVAHLLCSQLDCPSGEIMELEIRSGASGTLRYVLDSVLRRRPPIRYVGPDPKNFSSVVLISPIWVYRLAGPMRSFIVNRGADLARLGLISVMGSRGAANAVAEVDHLMGRAPILTAAFTTREVDDGSYAARLEAFGKAVRSAGVDAEAVRPKTWSSQEG